MAESARLFFALWPTAAVAGALDGIGSELHRACGGRRMQRRNIHLTLVFLGNVELDRLDSVRAVARAVRVPPFALALDKLGWWRHNRVAWVAPALTPEALSALVNQLQDGLRAAGIAFDDRAGYSPHVTLLRNARCDTVEFPPLAPLPWEAVDFVLVRSATREDGVVYEVTGRWALGAESL